MSRTDDAAAEERNAQGAATALAVWQFGRPFGALFSGPSLPNFSGPSTYILSGVILRRASKISDFLFDNNFLLSGYAHDRDRAG